MPDPAIDPPFDSGQVSGSRPANRHTDMRNNYGWACTDPDCNVTDLGPYTAAEADMRRCQHEARHVATWDDVEWLLGIGRWGQ